jgi:hypothetical protein
MIIRTLDEAKWFVATLNQSAVLTLEIVSRDSNANDDTLQGTVESQGENKRYVYCGVKIGDVDDRHGGRVFGYIAHVKTSAKILHLLFL